MAEEKDHERLIITAARKLINNCGADERRELLTTIEVYERDLIATAIFADERLHHALFIRRLGASH